MRLPLTRALALLLAPIAAAAACTGAQATHAVSTRMHVYDDVRLRVVSPSLRDEVTLGDSALVADYAVDAVSGATQALTVDAVTSATRFDEQRHQLGVSARHFLTPETEASAGYAFSTERDHTVHAPTLGVSTELLSRMVRASARYQLVAESIGRVDDPRVAAHALGHRVDLGWTQIATAQLALTALATGTLYTCSQELGCFANPYRYVGVYTGDARIALPERHPDARASAALALRAAYALGSDWSWHAGYRYFTDDWQLASHTVDTELASELWRDRLLARARARATTQEAAAFFRTRYQASDALAPQLRTADAELSRLWNLELSLHLEWELGPVRLVTALARSVNRYPDFPSLPERDSWKASIGLDGDY